MKKLDNNNFLGLGWNFPPKFNEHGKTLTMISNEEEIYQSLVLLLQTVKGQRLMRSNFHCDLQPFVFHNVDNYLINQVKNTVSKAILLHEARIELDHVDVEADSEEPGMVNVKIEYRIRANNSRQNIVFPFYLKEGTNIVPMEVAS
ncbi:MAG: GPW/gp25 family protein [Alteromonadaceae bacterium]|nr:GPW/gp25 family protein [Alteromonadaceae bacterium]